MDVELRLAEEASTQTDRSASDHWLRASREGEEGREGEGGKPVSSPIFFLALPARLGIGRRGGRMRRSVYRDHKKPAQRVFRLQISDHTRKRRKERAANRGFAMMFSLSILSALVVVTGKLNY